MSDTRALNPGHSDPADIRRQTDDSLQQQLAELDAVIAVIDAERAAAQDKSVREAELTMPWPLFIRHMRLRTPQAYGSRIESYMSHFYGWTTVHAAANRGDATVEDGSHVEIKSTIITSSNDSANIRQIRPYQDIAGYRIFVVDADYHVWRFDLTKEQMGAEIELVGRSSHMVSHTASKNPNREFSIQFAWDLNNETCARWIRSYLMPGATTVTPDMMDATRYENASQVRLRYNPVLEFGVEPTLAPSQATLSLA